MGFCLQPSLSDAWSRLHAPGWARARARVLTRSVLRIRCGLRARPPRGGPASPVMRRDGSEKQIPFHHHARLRAFEIAMTTTLMQHASHTSNTTGGSPAASATHPEAGVFGRE